MLNFDAWNRAFGLPWRTHAWHVLLLTGFVLAVGTSNRWLIRINPDAATPARIQEDRREVRVLTLGNSQHGNWDDANFDIKTKNIYLPGADYVSLYALLRHLAPRMPKLEAVILGFDNLLLHTPAIKNRKGDYEILAAWGVPWWDIPDITWSERLSFLVRRNPWLKPILTGPKLDQPQVEGIITHILHRQEPVPAPEEATAKRSPDDPTWVRPGFFVAPANGEQKLGLYVNNFRKSSNKVQNTAALEGVADYCRQKHLRLVFLRTPTTKGFWSERPAEWDQELAALKGEAEERYGGEIPVWDEERSFDYPDAYFSDPNHLRREYVHSVLTPRINARLNAFLGEQPAAP